MPQAPLWLPYRWRNRIDQWRIEQAVARLDQTPPIPVANDRAPVEVHMLLCRRDLNVGLLAIKSLLRLTSGQWAVAFSDDGTLLADQRAWVSRHVPGSRWLSWPVQGDDAHRLKTALATYPRLQSLYASRYAPVCKLLHPMLLARSPGVLVMDPDTAFFARPDALLESSDQALYLHDHQDEATMVPPLVRQAMSELEHYLSQTRGKRWQLDHFFFNSGLLMFQPNRLDLADAEAYLNWKASAPKEYGQGKAAIWFGDWTPEQTCYMVMFALSGHAKPLGQDYHLGGEPGHVFNHFLRHYLIQSPTLRRLSGLVRQMIASGESMPTKNP